MPAGRAGRGRFSGGAAAVAVAGVAGVAADAGGCRPRFAGRVGRQTRRIPGSRRRLVPAAVRAGSLGRPGRLCLCGGGVCVFRLREWGLRRIPVRAIRYPRMGNRRPVRRRRIRPGRMVVGNREVRVLRTRREWARLRALAALFSGAGWKSGGRWEPQVRRWHRQVRILDRWGAWRA